MTNYRSIARIFQKAYKRRNSKFIELLFTVSEKYFPTYLRFFKNTSRKEILNNYFDHNYYKFFANGQDGAVIQEVPIERCEGVLQSDKTANMEVNAADKKDNTGRKRLRTGSLQVSPEKVVIPNLPGGKMKEAYKQLADEHENLKKRMQIGRASCRERV